MRRRWLAVGLVMFVARAFPVSVHPSVWPIRVGVALVCSSRALVWSLTV